MKPASDGQQLLFASSAALLKRYALPPVAPWPSRACTVEAHSRWCECRLLIGRPSPIYALSGRIEDIQGLRHTWQRIPALSAVSEKRRFLDPSEASVAVVRIAHVGRNCSKP
ncbi:hypothetical protein M011DRAFT_198829 [Sporormia fimetaria CBS 119925]|uniref:Uncharacterized protein n=1 Tax=Sporormia fimetaria CBS 119925 TaxID=1340428 RepID=A0A6A6V142_9PLEO|nr:hypothetical protein M011DRAFT_198829 [Sporormia fimetaria CBS 119925]